MIFLTSDKKLPAARPQFEELLVKAIEELITELGLEGVVKVSWIPERQRILLHSRSRHMRQLAELAKKERPQRS